MESREQTETHREDREQGTPQGQLLNEQSDPDEKTGTPEDFGAPEEGGADSATDAASQGG